MPASIIMSRTEALSLQLDTLQLQMQLNAKLMEDYPEGAALADALAKQNLIQEENLQLKAEASQLRARVPSAAPRKTRCYSGKTTTAARAGEGTGF